MADKNSVQSLDQQRAAFAWAEVANVKSGKAKFSDFINLAKGAPALIMSNGLMQTLAFLKQKGGEAETLQKIVSTWIHKQVLTDDAVGVKEDPGHRGQGAKERGEVLTDDFVGVMEALHNGSSSLYMSATEEALEILRWIRQFAPALGKD